MGGPLQALFVPMRRHRLQPSIHLLLLLLMWQIWSVACGQQVQRKVERLHRAQDQRKRVHQARKLTSWAHAHGIGTVADLPQQHNAAIVPSAGSCGNLILISAARR